MYKSSGCGSVGRHLPASPSLTLGASIADNHDDLTTLPEAWRNYLSCLRSEFGEWQLTLVVDIYMYLGNH